MTYNPSGGRLIKFEFYELESQHPSFLQNQPSSPVKIGRDVNFCVDTYKTSLGFYFDIKTLPNLGNMSIEIYEISTPEHLIRNSRIKSISIA